jgi:hypothetical protein
MILLIHAIFVDIFWIFSLFISQFPGELRTHGEGKFPVNFCGKCVNHKWNSASRKGEAREWSNVLSAKMRNVRVRTSRRRQAPTTKSFLTSGYSRIDRTQLNPWRNVRRCWAAVTVIYSPKCLNSDIIKNKRRHATTEWIWTKAMKWDVHR